MKKLIAFVIACSVLMMPLEAGAATMRQKLHETFMQFSETFPDVPNNHLNFAAVAMLVDDEIIQGYPDGTFKPDGQVNRAELMKMSVGMYYPLPEGDISAYQNCFPDVKTDWYAYYVCKAKELGWIEGYPDGTFKPGNTVNRVEAIKIIMNAMIEDALWASPTEAELQLPLPADADPDGWYKGYLMYSIAKELLDGQHVYEDANGYYYKPGEPMTRKEVAEMMYRTYVYMMERLEYVELIATTACFQLEHSDMDEAEAYDLWVEEVLTPPEYTVDDADWLSEKYSSDDVLEEFKADATEYLCGDSESVDMSKWDGFMKVGR